jgi:hypothetical protein
MATIYEIDLLLLGFALATCAVFFGDAWWRRVFMAGALACAVAVVLIYLMGIERLLAVGVLAYLILDWLRGRREAPTPRDSVRHRPARSGP